MEQEIQQLDGERRRLAGEEQGLLGRLDVLAAEARLLDARLQRLDLLRRDAEVSAAELKRNQARAEARLAEARRRLRQTVILLHQPGSLGRLRLILASDDAQQMAAGWRLAQELTARQRTEVSEVRTALRDVTRLRREQEQRAEELRGLGAEAAVARAALTAAIGERRTLLADIREQKDHRDAALAELERASSELQGILAGAAPHPVSLNINSFRGLLPMPASGPVLRAFGDRRDPELGAVLPHRGWDIGARYGDEVRAVFDGVVVWSSWFRGYGLMVVLDHGAGVHSVYAHLSTILVQNNARVSQGQLIGNVGDTGSLSGPQLYLEIRRGGRAEDPANWVRRGPAPRIQ